MFKTCHFQCLKYSQFSKQQQKIFTQRSLHCVSRVRNTSVVRGMAQNKKIGVLFVCLGNICRSPTAEAVFTGIVQKAGLQDKFLIDSCGTGGGSDNWYQPGGFSYHEGDPSDTRMQKHAKERGLKLTSRSRPLCREDLSKFDYILTMDSMNREDIITATDFWIRLDSTNSNGNNNSQNVQIPENYKEKVSQMTDYCKIHRVIQVPDPYFGGPPGFERVLDLLEDACVGLLEHIQKENVELFAERMV
eukprot:TRINITY_DN37010_c0_g1_i1.p1 TRINITY_DN37010_c0_g1~~TRINITY_DN37010_c0_g1_i1.p1  ORF type:complete len:275 (-),score=24.44 TRINITY_DN37010_c0_g1_i1:198-935(-)